MIESFADLTGYELTFLPLSRNRTTNIYLAATKC